MTRNCYLFTEVKKMFR